MIYKTLQELENKVYKFIQTLTPEIIRSVCGVKYIQLFLINGISSQLFCNNDADFR